MFEIVTETPKNYIWPLSHYKVMMAAVGLCGPYDPSLVAAVPPGISPAIPPCWNFAVIGPFPHLPISYCTLTFWSSSDVML